MKKFYIVELRHMWTVREVSAFDNCSLGVNGRVFISKQEAERYVVKKNAIADIISARGEALK